MRFGKRSCTSVDLKTGSLSKTDTSRCCEPHCSRGTVADLPSTHDRLVNWARWSRSGRAAGVTRSIEGRYRPELLREGEERDRRSASVPIDVRDALLVQRALCPTRGFPTKFRLVLSAEYILRLDIPRMQGYLRRHGYGGTNARDIDALTRAAVASAANAIRRMALTRE